MATYAQALDAIKNATGVLAAAAVAPVPAPELQGAQDTSGAVTIHKGRINYLYDLGSNASEIRSENVYIKGWNEGTGAGDATWHKGVPAILKPAPPAPTYFGSWETSVSAITTVVNAKWAATPEGGSDPAQQIQIIATRDDQIQVTGFFHIAADDTFKRKIFLVTLIDDQVAPSAANAKFQELVLANA